VILYEIGEIWRMTSRLRSKLKLDSPFDGKSVKLFKKFGICEWRTTGLLRPVDKVQKAISLNMIESLRVFICFKYQEWPHVVAVICIFLFFQ